MTPCPDAHHLPPGAELWGHRANTRHAGVERGPAVTLIGRHAWHTSGGSLFEGTITEHEIESPAYVKVENAQGDYRVGHPDGIALTLETAIRQAEENAAYWESVVNRLTKDQP